MSNVMRETTPRERKLASRSLDAQIAALATAQHGVVTRRQLKGFGLSPGGIEKRVASGRLHRIHRGVYAVGHPVLGSHGRRLAAVLTCGPHALLSYASAAALWAIRASAAVLVDVTVPGSGARPRRPGLRIHRARGLGPDERTVHHGIPVTTPERTLLDLAAVLPRRGL
jgi:predicted transcriptional regulator of viral defense system